MCIIMRTLHKKANLWRVFIRNVSIRKNRNGDYRKFAVTREECNSVIRQNLEKARWLCSVQDFIPDGQSILSAELNYWHKIKFLYCAHVYSIFRNMIRD